MGREQRRNVKSSWPKTVVKKWFNIKSGVEEFHSDYKNKKAGRVGGLEQRRKSCSDAKPSSLVLEKCEDLKFSKLGGDVKVAPSLSKELRVFVGTWNVGGKAPQEKEDLEDWLISMSSSSHDIYVFGFQEVVPLTAGNVLGPESKRPADTWTSLIRESLNSPNYKSAPETETELIVNNAAVDQGRYNLVASKQMVGIFLSVWVRARLVRHVTGVGVSCVGRGIMGYMGNKGSISISMTLREATICFVCTHLTSGEKEGDELRRNYDVTEILKKTKFSRSPYTILGHEKIIWLGDLNYRLATSHQETYELLANNDWQTLLEKDQLKIEQKGGRAFTGWKEGRIDFPPTYKFLTDSDNYTVNALTSKEKRRIPAWCDRILYRGKGLKQISYTRGESRFSDHRPVSSVFSVHIGGDDCVRGVGPTEHVPVVSARF